MYGKPVLGTGIVALPATGSSRPLFIAAVSLIAVGVIIMVAAAVMARKSRKSEANA
jgi:LPXTG-motif cell wall-anchored protein